MDYGSERILFIEYGANKSIIIKLLEIKRCDLKQEWIDKSIAKHSMKTENIETLEFLVEFQYSLKEFIYVISKIPPSEEHMTLLKRIRTYLFLTNIKKQLDPNQKILLNDKIYDKEVIQDEKEIIQIREGLSSSLDEAFHFQFLKKLKSEKKIEILLAELESRIALQISQVEDDIQCSNCGRYLIRLDFSCNSCYWPFCSKFCFDHKTLKTGLPFKIIRNKKFNFS